MLLFGSICLALFVGFLVGYYAHYDTMRSASTPEQRAKWADLIEQGHEKARAKVAKHTDKNKQRMAHYRRMYLGDEP